MDIEDLSLNDFGLENEALKVQRHVKVSTSRADLPHALHLIRCVLLQSSSQIEKETLPSGLDEVDRIGKYTIHHWVGRVGHAFLFCAALLFSKHAANQQQFAAATRRLPGLLSDLQTRTKAIEVLTPVLKVCWHLVAQPQCTS